MKKVEDVTAMVIDLGLFVEMARTMGRTMKKVYYCNPSWVTPFPKMNVGYVGMGFPEIEVCLSAFDHFEDIDLYVFMDVGHGKMQNYLESVGKAVWGCRMAEELEFHRDWCKEAMKKLGLPVGPYVVKNGTTELREYLKGHNDQYVKINQWRGHFESFDAKNYSLVEPRIDEIDTQLGKLKELTQFIVEEELKDCFEVAIDAYNIDGELPSKMLYGCEIKDLGYIGKFASYEKEIPDVLKKFDKAFAPILKAYGARTFYDPETRIGKDHIPYMIDLCIRAPSPPNELYQVFYTNLADIIWQGANGICIDPIPAGKWGCEIIIHSPWACDNWQPIEVPKEYERFVKLRNAVRIDGKTYTMPQVGKLAEIGGITAYGNTMEEPMEIASEIAASVKGYYLEIPTESLERAEEEIEKARKFKVWLKGDE